MDYLNKSFDGIIKKNSKKISQKSAEILKIFFWLEFEISQFWEFISFSPFRTQGRFLAKINWNSENIKISLDLLPENFLTKFMVLISTVFFF